jgi:AmmeMemoRadiSam system protein A
MELSKAYLLPHPPLIVPGVGEGNEIPDTRAAFERVAEEVAAYAPETVIFITPHSSLYADYIHISPGRGATGSFSAFRAGSIGFEVTYDESLAQAIGEAATEAGIPAGFLGEEDPHLDHGVMVPLYFLKSKNIVRISLSGLSLKEHYRLGMAIAAAVRALERKVVLIASGDMSHRLKADGPYGFAPEGPAHDTHVKDCLTQGDFLQLLGIDPKIRKGAAECGLASIVVAAGALDGRRVHSEVYSYEGPYGVGYMVAALTAEEAEEPIPSLLPQLDAEDAARISGVRETESPHVKLARLTVESYAGSRRKPDLSHFQGEDEYANLFAQRAGVFVSIKKDGELRGCIGTIQPTKGNLAEEILSNAVSASTRDPRFEPIEPDELASLTYSVDVLGEPEEISGPEELDIKRYGVIVSSGARRGLLLPDLDGINSVDEQIDIARRKAGIYEGEPYSLARFEVIRYK